MPEQPGAGRLDPETLAAYIDGLLPPEERARVDAEIAADPEAYEWVVNSIDAVDDPAVKTPVVQGRVPAPGPAPTPEPVPAPAPRNGNDVERKVLPFHRRRSVQGLFGALLAAAAAAVLVVDPTWLAATPLSAAITWWSPETRPEVWKLAASTRDVRAAGGRLTGGFAWSPSDSTRGVTPRSFALSPAARIAIARIDELLAEDPSPRRRAAAGTARLVAGDVDGAVAALEESIGVDESRAFVWTDLSSAYLARAARQDHAADLPRALEAADRALQIAPTQAEAVFNKALALERLSLAAQAAATWQRYLALDGTSAWAAEAREHLDRLLRSAHEPHPPDLGALRDQLFDELLPRWAAFALAGRAREAQEALLAATSLARLAEASTDHFAWRLVEAASRGSEGGRSRALAHGVFTYGRARNRYRAGDFQAAAGEFVLARRLLTSAGSDLSLLARFHEGVIAYRRGAFSDAATLLTGMKQSLDGRDAPSVVGRVDWTLGLIALFEGRFERSISLYTSAIAKLEKAGERANAAFVRGLLASVYDQRGDLRRAWQVRVEALKGSDREGTLLRAAQEAMRAKWPLVALHFGMAAVERARSLNLAPSLADALRVQATIHQELGESALALERLREADLALGATAAGPAADRVRAEIDVARATLTRGTRAEDGIAAATRALNYFQSTIPPALERLPELYLLRARLHRNNKALDLASNDLKAGIDVLLGMRRHVPHGSEQANLSDVIRRLVDDLVVLSADAGTTDDAFDLVEKARAWDIAPPATLGGRSLAETAAELASGVVVLDYVVSDAKTFAWIVTRSSARFVGIPISRAELSRLVRAGGAPRFDRQARDRLHALLLAPAERELAAASSIVVVPDGPLHGLSFAALPGSSSRYLIEEHNLSYSPGAALLRDSAKDAQSGVKAVLAVGGPAFDADAYPDLAELPGAEQEATIVARLYGATSPLLGASATREAFVRIVPTADVVHFAGHALANSLNAAESALIFAGSEEGRLNANAIRALSLPRTRLVVLSACDTANGVPTDSQGPMSLARAFLAAGAQAVVATLWPVSDTTTARLLARFHEEYSRGRNAAEALRHAQRSLVNANDPRLSDPTRWAGFVVSEQLR